MYSSYRVRKRMRGRESGGKTWVGGERLNRPVLEGGHSVATRAQRKAQLTHGLVLVLSVICFTTWQ